MERVEQESKLQEIRRENRQLTDRIREVEDENSSLKNQLTMDKEDKLDFRRFSNDQRQKLEIRYAWLSTASSNVV